MRSQIQQRKLMGSICANNFEKQEGTQTVDTYKNSVQLEGILGEKCSIALILGHYKQHRSDSFLALTELKHIQHCDAIRDYTNDPQKTLQIIQNMRKSFYKANTNKSCPYRKLLIGVLATYVSEDQEEYIQQYRNILRQSFQASREITIQFMNTIEGIYNLPNQLLISILLQQLLAVTIPVKVYLITTEKKMMNLYRFELFKTEAYSIQATHQ